MRTLVVYCHPVPESYCAALRDAVVEALRAKNDEVRLVDLYAEGFDPVMPADERRHYNEGASQDPVLQRHYAHLAWAEAIVFVYPTWWYALPAMLKGWLDRVWARDVAFKVTPEGNLVSLLSHIRKIGVVTTNGASWRISFLIGQPGRKTLLRGMRALAAKRCKTLFLAQYEVEASTPQARTDFLAKVSARIARW